MAREQLRRNRAQAGAGERYAAHRHAVTAHLLAAAGEARTLAVMGAGNCHDLDLPRLCQAYQHVHLFDVDAEALRLGVAAQGAAPARIELHCGIDLTGLYQHLEQPLNDLAHTDLEQLARQARPLADDQHYDVAASVGLLSQLMDGVGLAMGHQHPRYVSIALAVRDRHLELLWEVSRPRGAIVLVTEVVSSVTLPELPDCPDRDLPALMSRAVQQRNFFTGLNPWVIVDRLRAIAEAAGTAARIELSPPWRWDFGPRIYLCCAVVASRSAGAT